VLSDCEFTPHVNLFSTAGSAVGSASLTAPLRPYTVTDHPVDAKYGAKRLTAVSKPP
jgi:hypothetical protein